MIPAVAFETRRHPVIGTRRTRRLRARVRPWLLALALAGAAWAPSALAQVPEADVFVARAVVAYNEQRFDDALVALQQALELAPEYLDAVYYRGLTLFALGRTDEAAASFEQVLKRQPDDDASLFQLGLISLTRKDYEQAESLLERAFALNPSRETVGYYVGILRYRKREYARAIEAFRKGVATSPEIQTLARVYTGLALSGLGQRDAVSSELEEAMKIQPASPLTGVAERLRQSVVTGREREQRFRAELRLGAFYDDNVSVTPDESSDPFIQDLRRHRHDSPGALAALHLEYSLLRRPSVETTVTYSFFALWNNDQPHFNLVNHLAGVTTTFRGALAGLPVYVSLPYTYEYFSLGDDPYLHRHIFGPWVSLIEGNHNLTTLQVRYMNKDFFEKPQVVREDNRDATNWMIGVTHLLRFDRDRYIVRFGHQWDSEDAKGRNWSYDGHRALAGAQVTLPWGAVRLSYDFDVHIRDYRQRNTTLPVDAPDTTRRFDTEYTHVARITVPLPNGFSFVLQYQGTRAHSNLDLFDYTRNVGSALVVWTY